MIRNNKIMALIAGGALALAGTGYAAQTTSSPPPASPVTQSSNKVMTSATRGKIKSISDNQIVVERRLKTGPKDMTFVINSSTLKQGDLKAGERVVVHYRKDENNQESATVIRLLKAPKKG